jgi:cytochrome P450
MTEESDAPLTLKSAAVFECPYPLYDRIRASGPVFYDRELDIFVVARQDVAKEILADWQRFSNEPDVSVQAIYANDAEMLALYEREGGFAPRLTLPVADPPVHRRHRALLEKALGAANVQRLKATVLARIDEIMDVFIARGFADYVKEFSLRLPVSIQADLLGMSHDHLTVMLEMADSTVKLNDGRALSREEIIDCHRVQIRGQKVFQPFVERYRNEPQDNLLSHLVNAVLDNGERLTDAEVHGIIQVLLVGGNDTTVGALSSCMLFLARDPLLQERLRSTPSLIAPFVEEALRLESPVQGLWRRATRDTELHGVAIPAGAMINMRYGAINRDENAYACASAMNLERPGIRNHSAFGGGIHYCAGSLLARMEVNGAVARALQRMRDIRLDPPDFVVRYVPKLAVRNAISLPIRFTAVP